MLENTWPLLNYPTPFFPNPVYVPPTETPIYSGPVKFPTSPVPPGTIMSPINGKFKLPGGRTGTIVIKAKSLHNWKVSIGIDY